MTKFLKIFGVVLLILTAIAYSTSDYFIEKQLTAQLSDLINKDSLKLYNYEFLKLDLSLVTGSIKLKGVKLHPSKYALESIRSKTGNVRVLVDLSFDQISMNGFEINHFLKTKEILVDKLIIEEPKITYLFNPKKKSQSNTLGINNIFSSSFKKATLHNFIIEDAEILIKNIVSNKELISVKKFDFELHNAFIDSLTINRFSPFDYDDIHFTADNLTLDFDQDFNLSTKEISFDSKSNTTSIKEFKLQPKYSQGKFSKKYNVQKQWVAITLKELKVSTVNFEELIQHGNFNIESILIDGANVGLYKDKSAPEPPFKTKPLPASALKKIPVNISINTIEVKNSRIVINEKSKLSEQVSYLSFEDLNAQIYGFSNDSLEITTNNHLSVFAKTKIMNSAQVNFEAKFDLLSKNDSHVVKANIGPSDIKIYNKVLEPMMLVVAKSGKINALNYAYKADNTGAIGTIDFEYENVKIDILDKEEHTKKQGFMSLAANTIIKSTNKKENKKTYVQGIIKVDRVKNKNIFPYLWHTVQTGIIYTMAPAFSDIKKEEKKANKKGWFKKK